MRVEDFGPAPLDDPSGYPGRWPAGPVLLSGAAVVPLQDGWSPSGRAGVVAIGPNACPAHLRRCGLLGDILLTPTTLRNHVVAYAGHVTAYGAVPATLVRWPGARARVFIVWLNPEQELLLDETESTHYQSIEVPTDEGVLHGYRARTGHMPGADGEPVPVGGISQTAPGLPPAVGQRAAMSLLRNRVY